MNDSIGRWLFFGILFCCAAMFIGIGVYAFRSKKPMHFWSGSEVDPAAIRDIKAYNRANGWMWCVFGGGMVLIALLGLWNPSAAGMMVPVWIIGGLPVLVICYNRVYKKYKQ